MPQYKLYYFDLKGRAEVIRMLFAIAGQKYEDVRFTLEKWPEYKAKAPFGQCPYLEVIDGENTLLLAQSAAITRYLAKKFDLAGKTDEESVIIDMYADQIGDISNDLAKYFKQTCPEKKKEFEEKLIKEILPVQLKYFEDRLIKSGSGFIAPSGLTWVDLLLFVIYDWIPQSEKCFSNFKHLSEHRRKVAEQPEIAKWLKIRPNTPM